ncbi:MAG: helix-turn-helix transcriptional regulator [Chloroflexi bacterium]|nr:helix-turn-helix transcriptional regulator [Chloroflexota bacterium]
MPESSELRSLLAQLREKGWTWSAVAEEMHVHRNAIDRWARGERVPQQEFLVVRFLRELAERKTVPPPRLHGRPGQPPSAGC